MEAIAPLEHVEGPALLEDLVRRRIGRRLFRKSPARCLRAHTKLKSFMSVKKQVPDEYFSKLKRSSGTTMA